MLELFPAFVDGMVNCVYTASQLFWTWSLYVLVMICRINQKPDKGEPSIGTLFYFKAKGEKSTNSKFNHSLDSMIQVLYEDDNMTRHMLNFTSLIWITFLCVCVLLHHLMLIDFQTLTWITVGKCT